MSYRNMPVIVTGGLGFIGSNLAIRLVELGARVTIVDSSVAGCGANPHNIAPVRDRVEIVARDVGDADNFASVIRNARIIFNLAGEISHIHSMEFPERDLLINTVAQLRFLQACVKYNPGVRIVYAGTRQIFGRPQYLPIDEQHPQAPVDFNGVHKFAASSYHLMLCRGGFIDAAVLRLTNVYGPRMALSIPCQGFLSTFFRLVLQGFGLTVFGSGEQLRDPLFVDDAVEAFLVAGLGHLAGERCYNVGGPEALSVLDIARLITKTAGDLPVTIRPFPADRAAIDIGSYVTDSSLMHRVFGWKPATTLSEGLVSTLAYYRSEMSHYLDPSKNVECTLPEHKGMKHKLLYAAI